jgi:hypothetical protein
MHKHKNKQQQPQQFDPVQLLRVLHEYAQSEENEEKDEILFRNPHTRSEERQHKKQRPLYGPGKVFACTE